MGNQPRLKRHIVELNIDNSLFDWLRDTSIGTERAAKVGICSLTHKHPGSLFCNISQVLTINEEVYNAPLRLGAIALLHR